MVSYARSIASPLQIDALREMFAARKQVFVDLLGWDVPVLEGLYELDQFDDEDATYLIVRDGQGGHAGSTRLLGTTRPHILDSLFPQLCAVDLPRGPDVFEITRFCLARAQGARARLEIRNRLISGLVDFALEEHYPHLYRGRRLRLAAADPLVRLGLPPARPAGAARRAHARRDEDRD